MGNELWASPITGYRRRGTRLRELRKIIGSRIIARVLYEPLQSCPADAPAWEMLKILKKRDFDVAGVKIAQAQPVIGFVLRDQLKSAS